MNNTTTMTTDVNALLDTAVATIKEHLLVITQGADAVKAAKEAAKENNHAKAARTRETLRGYLLASGLDPLSAGSVVLTRVCQDLAEAVADTKVLANKKQDACRSVCKAFESITQTAVVALCVDKSKHIYSLEIAPEKADTPESIAASLIKKWDKAGVNPHDVVAALLDALAVDTAKAEAMEAARQAIQIFA